MRELGGDTADRPRADTASRGNGVGGVFVG